MTPICVSRVSRNVDAVLCMVTGCRVSGFTVEPCGDRRVSDIVPGVNCTNQLTFFKKKL